jgi:acyl-CoA synthetase (AMP-forming)/AMP-acid ligase II
LKQERAFVKQQKNAMHMLSEQIRARPEGIAFWEVSGRTLTFGEVGEQIAHAQGILQRRGFRPGMRAVLFAWPSAGLFSWIGAIVGLGGTVVVMEPWMSGVQVTRALDTLSPTHFVHGPLGWFWGLRLGSIRKIPTWVSLTRGRSRDPIHIESVDPLAQAVITFTTGSTGNQKGVVRTHTTLNTTRDILLKRAGSKHLAGPDLCIFSGFTMMNLATGRTTLLVSPWKRGTMKAVNELPPALKPVSLSTGPAFLKRVLDESNLATLLHLDVGGAPCDCNVLERAVERWPQARVNWVYGGTEVEPITITNARLAIQKSRERGFFQVLFLGKPVPEIRCENQGENLWVQGPHVSPLYIASPEENARFKRVDDSGIWHCTGDRVLPDDNGDLWYEGRSVQSHSHFLTEQKIYAIARHSSAFVFENARKELCVAGVNLGMVGNEIKSRIPEIRHVINIAKIHYDRRHHARIDRATSVKKEVSPGYRA